MREGLAGIRRRLAWPVALLALLAATLPAAVHRDGMHAAGAASLESLDSGCEQQHPPRWEAVEGRHRADCPGCLSQLQRGTAAPAVVAPFAPPAPGLAIAATANAAPSAPPSRHTSPRGPPVLPG